METILNKINDKDNNKTIISLIKNLETLGATYIILNPYIHNKILDKFKEINGVDSSDLVLNMCIHKSFDTYHNYLIKENVITSNIPLHKDWFITIEMS